MVAALDRKLLRDLGQARGLLLAITSIMAVGVAAYVAMGSAYRNLTTAKALYYAQCRMADFSLDLKKVPLAELDTIARLPGVVEIRPRIRFFATVDLDQMLEPVNGLVLSLPDTPQPIIDDVLLRQGSYFTDTRDNEVILNEAFARHHKLYPGQWIYLILNNRRQALFIVGTAISSEFTYLLGPGAIVPDPAHFGVFYLKRSYMEEVFDFDGAANEVLGTLAPSLRDTPGEVLRQSELLLDDYGVFSTVPLADQASNRFLSNEIEGLRSFGKVMPTIFLTVAALVLNMLMTRLTEQQRVVVGTLKALGYSNFELFAHFIKFGLLVGGIGGLAGCGLGVLLSAGMTALYRQFFEFPRLTTGLYFDVIGTGMFLSFACGLVGAIYGARNVLRLEPAVAMRPKPPVQGGAIWLERYTALWSRLGFAWRTTLRNVVRHRVRTLAGIFAAAMGASVLVNGLMMRRATHFLVDFQFTKIQRSDVDLVFKDDHGREALLEVEHLPSVDHAEPVFDVGCTFTHGPYSRKGGIRGLLPDARLTTPRDASVQPVRIPPVGLAMSRKMAELMHVDVGDSITVTPVVGRREPREVPIVSIVDSYLGLEVYADIAYLAQIMDESFAMSGAQLAASPEPSARAALYRDLKQLPGLQAVTSRADMIANVNETLIKNQGVFISLLVMFAGVIFFGSVLNASLISLAERQREVATLRVLGYTPWQVGGLFLRETMVTNIVGTLVGLPLGYWLSVVVAHAYDTDWFRLPIVDPREVWVQTLLLGTAFGLAAHLVVMRAIYRMNWLDALKTQE